MLFDQANILLIEDDEDDAVLIKEMFSEIKGYHFSVDWESNFDRAKEKIQTGEFDLFLIDYYLGKENGIQLIDFIRSNQIYTPAILLTGRDDAKVDIDASRAGAFDYLVKADLDPDMLERSIRYSMKQGRIIHELDEKEKKYRSLFERSFDCIFLANQRFEMLELNGSFLDFFGFKPFSESVFYLKDIFANHADYEYCVEALKQYELVRNLEVKLVTDSGEIKPCLFNCVFIPDQADDFCCYQGIIRDLSLAKKAELDMMVAEKLSLTGKLARTIAHEIRNPLTNLNLALDNLKDELIGSEKEISLYTDIIHRSSNRIESLLRELLNSSKPRELHLELIAIDEVIAQILEFVKDRANLKGVEIDFRYEKGLPRIFVDREKLSIALLNIVLNGIEAIENQNGLVKITIERKNDSIFLVIADNGKGIEKENLFKIFDPFYTSKKEGTGLGLTSTLNILSSHNARIDVESAVGTGTKIIVEFPLPEM